MFNMMINPSTHSKNSEQKMHSKFRFSSQLDEKIRFCGLTTCANKFRVWSRVFIIHRGPFYSLFILAQQLIFMRAAFLCVHMVTQNGSHERAAMAGEHYFHFTLAHIEHFTMSLAVINIKDYLEPYSRTPSCVLSPKPHMNSYQRCQS